MTDPDVSMPVRIPADVEREDKVLAGLTGRQLLILAGTGLILYLLWSVTRFVVPTWAFLIAAIPIGACVTLVALGSRDGVSLDRLLLAAIRQRLAPRRHITAPGGVRPAPQWLASRMGESVAAAELALPAEGVAESATGAGVIDLGNDGLAVIATCSAVNFSLRTQAEQESLVAGFGRYLHGLTAPIQILIRAERLDLSAQIAELHERAPGLPHPALEATALEHADYLTQLSNQTDLLRRQILLVLREPLPALTNKKRTGGSNRDGPERRAADTRLAQRLNETKDLLRPAGIVVSVLDAGQATAVLAHACNPDLLVPPAAALAGTDDIITTATSADDEDSDDQQPENDGEARWSS